MRGISACQRCRRRKQKCDLKRPNCSNCEGARAQCLTYHLEKQTEIPRNYISNLESQVEKLIQENKELRAQTRAQTSSVNGGSNASSLAPPATSPSNSEASSNHLQDVVKSVKDVVVEPSRQPLFLGQSGGITLARLVMAAMNVENLPSLAQKGSQDHSVSELAAEASLPPRHAAEHLVEVYFQYRTSHMPIIGRSQVEAAIENTYRFIDDHQSPGRGIERDIFTTFMVFAIALCDFTKASGGRPSQSEGCFRSAAVWIEKVISYTETDLDTIRAVLFLAQFVALCPSWGSLWHLTGTALRLCIDIGLHWETEAHLALDPELLRDRRCLWFSTYHFDRALCITLGRPFGIIDESTNVAYPSPWSSLSTNSELSEYAIHNQRAHNHLFKLSSLESEIRHVLHSQQWPARVAYPRVNYPIWLQDIQPRLQEWYSTIPLLGKGHPDSIYSSQAYWDAMYYNMVLLLYRPNSTIYHTPTETLISFETSCKLIESIKVLQREGKIDIMWKWIHHLFIAGLSIIYDIWRSKEIRSRTSIKDSILSLQSCASTLSAMSEVFTASAGCRDAFDVLSSATIDRLLSNNVEEVQHTNVNFDAQVKDLLQQLHPTGYNLPQGGDSSYMISNILSSDNFALGEMLSSAAEWPDIQNDFGDMDTP